MHNHCPLTTGTSTQPGTGLPVVASITVTVDPSGAVPVTVRVGVTTVDPAAGPVTAGGVVFTVTPTGADGTDGFRLLSVSVAVKLADPTGSCDSGSVDVHDQA